VRGDLSVVPPGRYRRGSVSHSWSETTVSENNSTTTSVVGLSPERLYTPVDELLSSATTERQLQQQQQQQQQVRGSAGTSNTSLTDDGPYTRTAVYTAQYSDTCKYHAVKLPLVLTPCVY